jgi:cephalosporin hydroxylase
VENAIEGYSTDPSVVGFIEKEFISQASVVLVILDSDHGEKVAREEIQTYSRIVSIGSYLVVEDTWIDGAKAAVDDFLKTTQEFVVDTSREHLMFTLHRGGYLTRIE